MESTDPAGNNESEPNLSDSLELNDSEDDEAISDEAQGFSDFYWKQGRENLFTESGLRMFQLAYKYRDQDYETARPKIDSEYETLSPRLQRKGRPSKRHGGSFGNYIALFEEMGIMYREFSAGKELLRVTPAGEQAALLIRSLPEHPLRVIPYFLLELLSRYQFNNPLNKNPKNADLAREIKQSDIFPYWSLYRIMRGTNNHLTKDELARFVFKTKRMEELPAVVVKILNYREDINAGLSQADLDKKYGVALKGPIGQPKYIMGRAGVQVGLIQQKDEDYKINPYYLSFIDELIQQEPTFEELEESSWIRKYGAQVATTEEQYLPCPDDSQQEPLTSEISEEDPIYIQVCRLIQDDKFAGVILIGPPGTGKSWYARQIAIKMVGGDGSCLREVQFHPSYQYEDFVEGYVPDGKGRFHLVDRHLLLMCAQAQKSDRTHVLVIDELSRTDPARVMGEAMTYMESSLRGKYFHLPSGRQAMIPSNLVFIATMNPEDRSVDEIDAAMDRRWGKIYLSPDPIVLESFLKKNGMQGSQRGAVVAFFKAVQKHYKLGHAFFRTTGDDVGLQRLWDNQLRFLFEKAFRYDPDTFKEIQAQWGQMRTSMTRPEGEGSEEPSSVT